MRRMDSSRVTGDIFVVADSWIRSRCWRHRVASWTHMILIRPARKIVGSAVQVIPPVRSVPGSSTSTKYSGLKDSIGSLVSSLAMDHEALDAVVAWGLHASVCSCTSVCRFLQWSLWIDCRRSVCQCLLSIPRNKLNLSLLSLQLLIVDYMKV